MSLQIKVLINENSKKPQRLTSTERRNYVWRGEKPSKQKGVTAHVDGRRPVKAEIVRMNKRTAWVRLPAWGEVAMRWRGWALNRDPLPNWPKIGLEGEMDKALEWLLSAQWIWYIQYLQAQGE